MTILSYLTMLSGAGLSADIAGVGPEVGGIYGHIASRDKLKNIAWATKRYRISRNLAGDQFELVSCYHRASFLPAKPYQVGVKQWRRG